MSNIHSGIRQKTAILCQKWISHIVPMDVLISYQYAIVELKKMMGCSEQNGTWQDKKQMN